SYQLCDVGSNNGTVVNGNRIFECLLADGDQIRIGDTVLCFTLRHEVATECELNLPDNGLVAVTSVQQQTSDSVETAIQRLIDSGERDEFASFARILLRIGASLRSGQEPEAMQLELMKHILEAVPAEQAAIVLLPQGGATELTITGWDVRRGEAATV